MTTQATDAPLFHSNDTVVLAAIGAVFAGTLAYAAVYDNFWLGALLGLLLLLGGSFGMAWSSQGGQGSRVMLPVLGMAMVGLMIHVSRGHKRPTSPFLPSWPA